MAGGVSKPLVGLAGSVIESTTQRGVSYRLEHEVGKGGSGVAFFAHRLAADGSSPVVIKVTRPDFLATAGDAAALMIQKEAVSLGRLNEHVPPTPFVVRLVDSGVVSLPGVSRAVPWNAVEYIHGGAEGTTLHARIRHTVKRTGASFDLARAQHCLVCVTEGLKAIHAVNVVHRDLSTNNVLCCGSADTEIFKIVDFGIARPSGVRETFGDVSLGTPGYAAPEQLLPDLGPTGAWSDVFSLAAITYAVLTGEAYFDARSSVEALIEARDDRRKKLADSSTLCAELRGRPSECAQLDRALARATTGVTSARPQTVEAFVGEIAPWISPGPGARTSRPAVGVSVPEAPSVAADWRWTVRHQPGGGRVIRSVAWDGDGRCLAATTDGLAFWNGMTWADADPAGLSTPDVRFVTRIGTGRWLVGGASMVAVYTAEGARSLPSPTPRGVTFEMGAGDPADLAVLIGVSNGAAVLHTVSATRWFRPVPASKLVVLASIVRVADAHFVVAGRTEAGRGAVARFSPLSWEVEDVGVPETRAFTATASQRSLERAIAVGAAGAVVRFQGARSIAERVGGDPDLASAAVDVDGRCWAGSAATLFRREGTDAARWERAWHDASWTAPFVSLYAQNGLVFAMTADGAVLEGRRFE